MKLTKKLSVIALSALLAFGTACDTEQLPDSGGVTPPAQTGGYYGTYAEDFQKYDNVNYNEYLMGENVTIANQWEGYGIGDPFVMRWNGVYYLYCSTLDSEMGVRGYKSADLINWTPMTAEGLRNGYVSEDPVTRAAYAPEVYYFNGMFYMYTSPGGNGHYILTSTSPEGPFVKATNNFGLSIDGSVLIDDDETMWFTYADFQGIRMAKLTDMLTVDVASTPVLNGTSIGGWTEGSYILKRDGIYYLTYTGNHVASDGYRIAYATADNVCTSDGKVDRNAWTRGENNPMVLETETALKGLGHSSTVMGPDMDSYYLVYHMLNSSGGPNRSLGIDRLTFNGKQMSVAPSLTDSVKPALPAYYANGTDEQKFTKENDLLLTNASHGATFTAEFNVSGASTYSFVFDYTDANNYAEVALDLTAKTVTLCKITSGASQTVATGTLVNDFGKDALHTVRIAARDGKVDVTFDNMVKIDNAQMQVEGGKAGYKGLTEEVVVGYTAISDVAMGLSDQQEAKQAEGIIGASNYLASDEYCDAYSLAENAVTVLDDEDYYGVKALTLNNGDHATYLVNFRESARYGLELVYRAEDAGKQLGVKLYNGTIWRCALPEITGYEGYVKALIAEFDAEQGVTLVRIENLSEQAVNFISFKFVKTSAVTPVYENTLEDYASTGVDYKTIWKIKDGGHYAKAGTRQLAYFGDNTITDFTLEVDIKLEGETSASTAGIVFHAQNYAASSHDNYMSMQGYYVAVNNNYVTLERLNYSDGTQKLETVAGSSNPYKTSDTFITLKIQVRGNTIKVWAADELMFETVDYNPYTAGKIGLYTNGAAVVYKNLKIGA